MSLREHERRILAEIERRLSEDDPELAGRLKSFGEEGTDASADLGLKNRRPWVACGLIAAVSAALLVLLFVLTPSAPPPQEARPTGTSESSEGTDSTGPGPVLEGETVEGPSEPVG